MLTKHIPSERAASRKALQDMAETHRKERREDRDALLTMVKQNKDSLEYIANSHEKALDKVVAHCDHNHEQLTQEVRMLRSGVGD